MVWMTVALVFVLICFGIGLLRMPEEFRKGIYAEFQEMKSRNDKDISEMGESFSSVIGELYDRDEILRTMIESEHQMNLKKQGGKDGTQKHD